MPKIRMTRHGWVLTEGWFCKRSVVWSAVTRVEGVKCDMMTFEELFLAFHQADQAQIRVGELDHNFAILENGFADWLPGFPLDWRTQLESLPVGQWMDLWPVRA